MKRIELQSSKINPFRKENFKGVNIQVCLSSYEVPQSLCHSYNEQDKALTIIFNYIEDDFNLTQYDSAGDVKIFYGKTNKLVQKIIVPFDLQNNKEIKIDITISILNALDRFKNDVVPNMRFPSPFDRENEVEHIEVLKRAVQQESKELISNS